MKSARSDSDFLSILSSSAPVTLTPVVVRNRWDAWLPPWFNRNAPSGGRDRVPPEPQGRQSV